ncbi:hypothetical protein PZA11_002864 [Diplocarpon coronariae]
MEGKSGVVDRGQLKMEERGIISWLPEADPMTTDPFKEHITDHILFAANKAWRQPLDFIPKRWHSKPELIRNKTGYAPFSTGRYGCMGKNLALMGLRTVAALLVTRFDIPLAPRADGKRLLEESEDYITTALESLMLCFKAR